MCQGRSTAAAGGRDPLERLHGTLLGSLGSIPRVGRRAGEGVLGFLAHEKQRAPPARLAAGGATWILFFNLQIEEKSHNLWHTIWGGALACRGFRDKRTIDEDALEKRVAELVV